MTTRIKQWSWVKKIIFSSFVAAIVTGVVANALTPSFSSLMQSLFLFAFKNVFVVITPIIVAALFTLIILQRNRAFKEVIESMGKQLAEATREKSEISIVKDVLTANLDKSQQLLHFVEYSSLKSSRELLSAQDVTDLDRKMHQFLKDFMADATGLIPEVYGASLLLPDSIDKDYLTIWEGYQVPEDSKIRTRCYIGADSDKKRGVAGQAYVQNKAVISHQTHAKGLDNNWKFDNDDYIHFAGKGTYPAFESFICVPIAEVPSVNGPPSPALGALCFDSQKLTAFDSPFVQDTLKQLGQCVASALLTYNKLRQNYFS